MLLLKVKKPTELERISRRRSTLKSLLMASFPDGLTYFPPAVRQGLPFGVGMLQEYDPALISVGQVGAILDDIQRRDIDWEKNVRVYVTLAIIDPPEVSHRVALIDIIAHLISVNCMPRHILCMHTGNVWQ